MPLPRQAGGGNAFGGSLFLFNEIKKSHYEILGVAKTAGNAEIKKAYFALVRKYQPDRFPEEFKEIRAAYETLSDSEKRAEYDIIGRLPPSVAPIFHEAQWLDHFGRNGKAAELYQMILKSHPELDAVREQYAKSLSANNKTGKASEVWEELCRRHPDDPHYARKLGKSYLDRGWNKKAVAETRRALTLDPSSPDGWSLLISCTIAGIKNNPAAWLELENVCREALKSIKTVKTDEWKKIYIYTYAFITIGAKERNKARDYIREIIRLTREGGRNGKTEGWQSLQEILVGVPGFGLAGFYSELQEMISLFPDADERSLRAKLEEIKINFDIEHLVEKQFPEIFRDLFRILNSDYELEGDELELIAIEFIILENKNIYDPVVRRLKTEFPILYDLHSSFFNEMLRTRDPDKMLYQRSKKIRKLRRKAGLPIDDEEDSDSGPEQPVHRTQPKVGRNDPCPCGSGKKYKKCCGR
jgi:curved DNA-binding protein CbpA